MDNKAKILKAASELFLHGGAAALSVRAIAKRADLSTIGIYSYFKGKQGILDTLCIEGFELISATVEDLEFSASTGDAVHTAVERYCDMAENHAAHYQLIFGEGDSSYTPSEAAKQAGKDAFALLVDRAAQMLPAEAPYGEKQEFALGLWALLHGYISLQHHAVYTLMQTRDWRAMIQRSVAAYLDARLNDRLKT